MKHFAAIMELVRVCVCIKLHLSDQMKQRALHTRKQKFRNSGHKHFIELHRSDCKFHFGIYLGQRCDFIDCKTYISSKALIVESSVQLYCCGDFYNNIQLLCHNFKILFRQQICT